MVGSKRVETFGEYLRRFAWAVDIVSPDILKQVFSTVADYLERPPFSVSFCEMAERSFTITGVPGLTQVLKSSGRDWSESLKERDASGIEQYRGQTSYAFDKEKRLWVVAADGGLLSIPHQRYLDLQGNAPPSEIPQFVALNDEPIKTSVIFPIEPKDQRLGVINFESTEYLHRSRVLDTELTRIAEALSQLYLLKRGYMVQSDSTLEAVKDLQRYNVLPFVARHKAFIASSGRANTDVMGAIRKVLNQFDIEVYYWKANEQSGNVLEYIQSEMLRSHIGICYFSEPAEATTPAKYVDNPNTLIEAGMMSALYQSPGDIMSAWIPIREKDSAAFPFDLRTEHFLLIERDQNGRLNEDDFVYRLTERFTKAGVNPR
jgi:hypothetical protein